MRKVGEQKVNNHNKEWSEILKSRPDLEPNPEFAKRLKDNLLEHGNRKGRKYNLRTLLLLGLSFVLFCLITASYFGDDGRNALQGGESQGTEQVPNRKVEVYDYNVLIKGNLAYKELYEEVYDVTELKEASKKVVYFFEALQRKDKKYLSENVSFPANPNKEIPFLIENYKGIDIQSIKVDYIVADQFEKSFEIVFSYWDTNRLQKEKNSIHLKLIDEETSEIIAPFGEFYEETNRMNAISMKRIEVERKMKLGITKEKATKLFGQNYFEGINSRFESDGSVSDWTYSYFPGEDYDPVDMKHTIDLPSLAERKIGLILNIGWSTEGKAIRMDMYYGHEARVYKVSITENGLSESQIEPKE